ncbi:unnamed protein product [Tilletia controversa]|uniref:Histone chaperone domain-containing protein n=3 Tax=Tilletia TaxID=13289 RepID=A0A8X7ST94_9BASI|nr:hypothetical protein CF336_g8024 [Tilletia laevis]KAE8184908.1 hypothetical protein CF328_g7711 [Tilletia controversa]KAE8244430.1 hypothetical protein A4X03_0g7543 [Tilletia caries]KAE8186117.1 hypothetical protein CF335_g7540 [Tilletia laevis]KAE8239230.1 hypothetical protein A4X06_0g8438 [Tilletia controversa]
MSKPNPSSAPRVPTEEVLGRALEAYILKAHEQDEDAAATFLTPRNIRNHLIQHFKLGSEHALDVRKLFIKNTSREVVERYRAGEPRLYPIAEASSPPPPYAQEAAKSSAKSRPSTSSAQTSTPNNTQRRRVIDDDDDEDEEEEDRRASKGPEPARRTPTKEELQKRRKAKAPALPSDEDETPNENVELSADSVSEDEEPSPKPKSKKRKATSVSPSPPPAPQRRRSSPPKSTPRSKGKRAEQPAPEPDDDSDDSMIDDVQEMLQKRRKKGTTKPKATAKGTRGGKKASAAQSKGKMDRLTTLKKLCVSCGARKVWATWFRSKGCGGDPESDPDVEREQINAVLELLESIGAHEGMTAKQAAKLKSDRELEKELADIGAIKQDDSDDDDSPGPNGQPAASSSTIVPGKRLRKPSAMAMASAEYEDMVSHVKGQQGSKNRTQTDAPGADPSPSKRSQASTAQSEDDTASSVFEMSDDEDDDEDMDGGQRRRRRRQPKNDVEEDFIVDDDEQLGYEKRRASRRVLDSDEEEEEERRSEDGDGGGGGEGSEQGDGPADGQDEVSLHLSTQFDEDQHQDKGEIPRRKQKAGAFRDDLKSFASALNS